MIWFETTTRIRGDTAMGRMIVLVTNLHTIMYGIGGFILASGTIIFLIAGYVLLKRRQPTTDSKIPFKRQISTEKIKPIV